MNCPLAARWTAAPPATDPVNDDEANTPVGNQPGEILVVRVQVLEDTVGQRGVPERLCIVLGHTRRLL